MVLLECKDPFEDLTDDVKIPLKSALIYSLLKMSKIHFKDLQKPIHRLSSEPKTLSESLIDA